MVEDSLCGYLLITTNSGPLTVRTAETGAVSSALVRDSNLRAGQRQPAFGESCEGNFTAVGAHVACCPLE